MATVTLRKEEAFGLGLAVTAHLALVVWLATAPYRPTPLPLPETMTVTLSEEAALQSVSPQPAAQPAPDMAPALGEAEPVPEPVARTVAEPLIRSAPRLPNPPKAQPAPRAPEKPATRPPGASRIGNDFLKGVAGANAAGTAQNPPAAAIGPAVRSALAGAISRQLKPRWTAPQGIDAEKLVTILSWSLNKDGTLAGTPRVVRQDGITDANRAQAARHGEQAVRAVQLAAPFNLPAEYYDAWKRIADFRFDRKLSQ